MALTKDQIAYLLALIDEMLVEQLVAWKREGLKAIRAEILAEKEREGHEISKNCNL